MTAQNWSVVQSSSSSSNCKGQQSFSFSMRISSKFLSLLYSWEGSTCLVEEQLVLLCCGSGDGEKNWAWQRVEGSGLVVVEGFAVLVLGKSKRVLLCLKVHVFEAIESFTTLPIVRVFRF